jgi:rhodanese-related sulfurtransferase
MRRALAWIAAIAGALALAAGDPHPVDIHRLAAAVAHEEDHVTAQELAGWLRGRKPGLRIVDIRSPKEFADYHLPQAENIPLESITDAPFQRSETIVLISGGGAHAAQAWVLLQVRGYRNVFFLRGGLQEWTDALKSDPKIGGYFGQPRRGNGC